MSGLLALEEDPGLVPLALTEIRSAMHDDLLALWRAWAAEQTREKGSDADTGVDAFADFVFRSAGVRLSDVLVDVERERLVERIGEAGLEGLDGGP